MYKIIMDFDEEYKLCPRCGEQMLYLNQYDELECYNCGWLEHRRLTTSEEDVRFKILSTILEKGGEKGEMVEVKKGGKQDYQCAKCQTVIPRGEAHIRTGNSSGYQRYHKGCAPTEEKKSDS